MPLPTGVALSPQRADLRLVTVRPIRASGVVVIRGTLGRPAEVLLIHRPEYHDWSLPKGKDDRGETPTEAALRELHEETGYRANILCRLEDQHYTVSGGRPKVVRYFLAKPSFFEGFKPGSEVDEIKWVSIEKAKKLLTYERDRELLDDPRVTKASRTGTVYLIRHAHAGERSKWKDEDHLRPLSSRGKRQARTIAERLADRGVDLIHSSPYVRCVDTVKPLGERLGLEILDSPDLAEGADPSPTLGLIGSVSGLEIALCSHGDIIPDVVDQLKRAGVELRSSNGRVGYAKGSVWEVTVESGEPVAALYHPPPRS